MYILYLRPLMLSGAGRCAVLTTLHHHCTAHGNPVTHHHHHHRKEKPPTTQIYIHTYIHVHTYNNTSPYVSFKVDHHGETFAFLLFLYNFAFYHDYISQRTRIKATRCETLKTDTTNNSKKR